MSQGSQACDGSSTVVASAVQWCTEYNFAILFDFSYCMLPSFLSLLEWGSPIHQRYSADENSPKQRIAHEYSASASPDWINNKLCRQMSTVHEQHRKKASSTQWGSRNESWCWTRELLRRKREWKKFFLLSSVVMVCFILWDFVL